jgi:hypothetical protein
MRARDYGRAERATTVEEKGRERATSTVEPEVENCMLGRHSEAVEHILRECVSERKRERVYEGVKKWKRLACGTGVVDLEMSNSRSFANTWAGLSMGGTGIPASPPVGPCSPKHSFKLLKQA